MASFRQHRFGMELDAERRVLAVGERHDFAFLGACGDGQRRRRAFKFDNE